MKYEMSQQMKPTTAIPALEWTAGRVIWLLDSKTTKCSYSDYQAILFDDPVNIHLLMKERGLLLTSSVSSDHSQAHYEFALEYLSSQ